MEAYRTKASRLPGTNFSEIRKKAHVIYQQIKKRSKRRAYIRSKYFKKDKIFIDIFWKHLFDKNWSDRTRRLRYFAAAIELTRHTYLDPKSKENPNKSNEILHRFAGITGDNSVFYVHIKEDKASGQKFLISIFPE